MTTVLITGSNSGIGLTTTYYLAKKGYFVYASMRNLNKAPELFKKFTNIKIIQLDVKNNNSIKKCIKTIIDEKSKIDILINNAGYGLWGAFEDLKIEEIKDMFETNFFGIINLTNQVLPHMRKQRRGKIINISSIAGRIAFPIGGAYSATKHALTSYSTSLQLEVSRFGIKVIVIEPGLIKTKFRYNLQQRMPNNSPYRDLYKALRKRHIKPRGSSPLVIAKKIHEVIKKKNPKLKYLIGKNAKLYAYSKNLVSDRQYEKLANRVLK